MLLEEVVPTYQERLASYLKKMLQRSCIVLQVTYKRCNNVAGTSCKLLEEDVTNVAGSSCKLLMSFFCMRKLCYEVTPAQG